MANPFEIVVQKMVELGFYDYLFPFIISAAIFYALLRRSRILGESVVTNSFVALSLSFMILGFPILVGFSFATPLATFFTQATAWILIFVVGMILASVFYPDLTKVLSEQFTKRTTVYEMLAVGVALFVTSGMVQIFTLGANPAATGKTPATPSAPTDIILIVSALIIFVVLILIASSIFRSSG